MADGSAGASATEDVVDRVRGRGPAAPRLKLADVVAGQDLLLDLDGDPHAPRGQHAQDYLRRALRKAPRPGLGLTLGQEPVDERLS